jgi:CBS domain-containing protein
MSVASFLNKTKISDIIRPKQDRGYTVIQVDENESLENAVKLLSDNGIQAVPVKSASSSQYIGFLTQLDLVTFILRKCCEEPSREEVERASEARPGQQLFEEARRGPNWDKYKDDIMKLQIAGKSYRNTPVKEVLGRLLTLAPMSL